MLTKADSKLQVEATPDKSIPKLHDSEKIVKEAQGGTTGEASMVANESSTTETLSDDEGTSTKQNFFSFLRISIQL